MIKFFRKIRANLLSDGKTGKYLKYGIGEIILVVIGILIAISINNRNERKKNRNTEVIYLNNLRSELAIAIAELRGDYEENLKYKKSTLNILKYLHTKPKLVDSMYIDFYNSISFNYFYPKKSTYESLKYGEMKLIRSDSLRSLITDVYESGFQRVLEKTNTRRNAARLLFPYYQKHFRTQSGLNLEETNKLYSINSNYPEMGASIRVNNYGIPNNYEHLLNDPEYETLISEAIIGRSMAIQDLKATIKLAENCMAEIDQYLLK